MELAGTSGYVTIDDLPIYYEVYGDLTTAEGTPITPIVLMHGGVMTIEVAYAPDLIARFGRTRPVIAIEQQGHGHTGDRPGPITITRMVDDTAGVLKHLGVERADLFGHSLGGLIAMGVAIAYPDLVRSVTAVGSSFELEGMRPELVTFQRDPTHVPSAELIAILPTEDHFNAWHASFMRHAPDTTAWESNLGKLNTMLAEWPGWTRDQLREIRAGVLVAIGDNDFVRVEHAAEMADLIPGAQLAVLPGTNHMSIIERGDWLEPMVLEMIAKTESPD